MTRIDRSYLSGDYPSEAFDGLVAHFFDDGHLEFLGYFENGECVRSLELDGQGAGRGTNFRGSGGNADWVNYYADGTRETFDAWSDNTRPHPYPYTQWVKEWIDWIEQLDHYQGGHPDSPY
jgi:hypothetical protein